MRCASDCASCGGVTATFGGFWPCLRGMYSPCSSTTAPPSFLKPVHCTDPAYLHSRAPFGCAAQATSALQALCHCQLSAFKHIYKGDRFNYPCWLTKSAIAIPKTCRECICSRAECTCTTAGKRESDRGQSRARQDRGQAGDTRVLNEWKWDAEADLSMAVLLGARPK